LGVGFAVQPGHEKVLKEPWGIVAFLCSILLAIIVFELGVRFVRRDS
jgi:hypothetical protein